MTAAQAFAFFVLGIGIGALIGYAAGLDARKRF